MIVQELIHFRENLRFMLAAKGVSQRGLAAKLGASHTYLNRILQGKAEPSLPICGKLADAVGCPLRDMLLSPAVFKESLSTKVA